MAENGQNISGEEDVADVMSLVLGIKHSRLQNDLEFNRTFYYGW